MQLVSPAVYEKHQQKSLKEAQVNSKNSFHCKTPDCQGFCFVTDNINSFKCPICKRLNCITCQVSRGIKKGLKDLSTKTFSQAIHEGQDCKQYQQQMLNESQDENSIKTKEWIEVKILLFDVVFGLCFVNDSDSDRKDTQNDNDTSSIFGPISIHFLNISGFDQNW